ncbi:MAG: hypothetical protein ACTSRZ_03005 [Promethearchaeota archaeon]
MKLWLNTKLECPDDHSFPFEVYVFKWMTSDNKFSKLLRAYEANYLINFKDEDNPTKIQVFDEAIFSNDEKKVEKEIVFKENIRLTTSIDFKNVISIFLEDNTIKIRDYNFIYPDTLTNYFNFYQNTLNELKVVKDCSNYKEAKDILRYVQEEIPKKFQNFLQGSQNRFIQYEHIKNGNESELVAKIIEDIAPILQDLLFLNYYLYLFEIEEGLLICPSCKKWNPVIKTIPRIFPKSIARQQIDFEFQKRWKNLFPTNVI